MSLQKVLKKILSVTLIVAFISQQSGIAFATTNVSSWSDLRSYVSSYADDYHVTTSLTASAYPNGTLYVNSNGRSVWGAALYENSTDDTLIAVSSGITFGLNNNIYGAISNNGTLNYSGNYLSNGSITGSGALNLSGSSLVNNNSINQTTVTVGSSGVMTNNAAVTSTSFNNNGTVDNNAVISAGITNTGTLYSLATNLAGTVANSGALYLEGGNVQAAINGSGNTNITENLTSNYNITQNNVYVYNNATFTNNAMLAANVSNASGSTLNSDPDNLGKNVANNGTLNLNADGTLSVAVSGTGTTAINGDLTNSSTISQKDVTVASGKVVTTNASDITATHAITNAGIINYTAGTTANTIEGTGRIDVTGYVTNNGDITQNKVSNSGVFTNNGTVTANLVNTNAIEGTGSITTGTGISSNNGTIEQAALTNKGTFDNSGHITLTGALTNNATFNTNADLVTAAGGVTNTGNFNITGGTNTNVITGAGTTNFSNIVTNNSAITQTLVTNDGNLTNNALITADVTNTGTLTSDGANIVGDIANTGTYIVSDGDNANDIIGTGGKVSFLGDTTNSGTIMQETLTVANSGSLTTNANLVTATITNDGKLEWNAGTANSNVINGSGQLDITNGTIANSSAINQHKIKITGGSLTSNADLLTTASGITNNVANGLTLTGGTNNNVIDGAGSLVVSGDVINNADIVQDTINVSVAGNLITLADDLTLTNGITNNGVVAFTGGANSNDITGTGVTLIDGTVENSGAIGTNITVTTNGHFATEADVTKTLENHGVLDLVDADIATTGNISGTGITNILGDTVNNTNATLEQSLITIASNGSLSSNNDKIVAAVANDGIYSITAGTGNAHVISGSGTLNITGGTIANTAAISQNQINITGGSLTSDADLLASVGGINNAATLGITGGTNNNVITGAGTTNFSNTVVSKADITQGTVTNSGNFTNDGANITANITNSGDFINNNGLITGVVTNTGNLASKGEDIDGDIVNNGTYDIIDGDNSNDITGTGDLLILGDTRNTGTISQDTITVDTGATFVAQNMSNVATTSGIDNAGTFEMQAGTNSNVFTGNTGTLNVTGIVANTSGVNMTQDIINIATLGNFTADAGDLHTVNGIANSGHLNLDDGATNNNISGTGYLAVIGTVNNTGNISQTSLNNTGTFTSDAGLLAFADGITNTNVLNVTGGTNNNVITGAGTTNLTGNVVNNATITQTTVTNAGTLDNTADITGAITNTGTINSVATNLVGAINNTGTLNVAGGAVQAAITGATGVMNITDDLVNAQSITQATVNNSANLTNSGAITAAFNNDGIVDNSAVITGAITNNGTINSTATNLVGDINNTNVLNLNGGVTKGTISGTGDTNILTDLVANHTINQNSVTNAGSLTNNTVITATTINNNGTITGAASDLVGAIVNEGTLVFNTASTGASNISGAGNIQVTANTTLTGANTNTGDTLVDGSTLTVAGASNLGTGDVAFANNGVLEVTAAGALDNVLKGLAATDNITVNNAAALTLNGVTGVANDFHKAGTGVMTLAMASNGYTGNTYVDAGTLIGKTSNINNTVNGAAGTTVEFTDTTDAELNAINTLGTFVQNGSAVLNVQSNAFTANQADINAGTFAANRALTATTMNVNTGATLRGNGNITGDVNVNTGATIAPGNSIDTLTITGDLNLAAGSTTAIEINETPASDKLVVTGATNIAGGANLTVTNENGRYFEWDSFDILESAGNVTGTFTYDGTVANYDASRINIELDYSDPTKVVLTAKRKATDYADTIAGLPRNASEVARSMDAVSTGFGGDITNPLLQLEQLGGLNPTGVVLINPGSTLLSALNDMTGVLYANAALTPLFNAKTAHVYDRIAKRNPSAGKCEHCHDNVWVEYYNQHDKVYADANSPRFTNNMTGVLVGYDRSSDNALLGVYAGFGKSDLRQTNEKMDIDDTSLGVYGGYMTGDWTFKGTLFGGIQSYRGQRSITFMNRTAEGKYDGVNLGLDAEASYNIPVYDWLNVKPFVGWLNNYSHQQAFAEKGADSLNLHVSGNDQFNSQGRLGVQLDGKIKNRFSWYGSVAVKQFFGNDYAKLHMDLDMPNTSMHIISANLGRTFFSGQLGVNYALTNNLSLFANLDTGVSDKSTNCYGNVGVAYTW